MADRKTQKAPDPPPVEGPEMQALIRGGTRLRELQERGVRAVKDFISGRAAERREAKRLRAPRHMTGRRG